MACLSFLKKVLVLGFSFCRPFEAVTHDVTLIFQFVLLSVYEDT